MRAPGLAIAASLVLAAEALLLGVLAVLELIGLGAGESSSLPTAIALIVLTLIGAALLFAFAAGARKGRSWARSGGIVLQVLAVVLALAALTLQPVSWLFVLGVGLPGLLGFALLVASARSEGRPEAV